MASKNSDLFRPKALERFASPDNLERLMPVTSARDSLPVAVTGVLLLLGAAWCVLGSVPTVVSGRGVLLRPSQIVYAQTLGPGRLLAFNVKPGETLRAGQLIAKLDQTELRRKIEEDRRTVAVLQEQDRVRTTAEQAQIASQSQQDVLERNSIEAQRISFKKQLADKISLEPFLKERLEATREMVKQGLYGRANPEVVGAEASYRDNEGQATDFRARLEQLDGQLKQIETRFATLRRDSIEKSMARANEIDQLRKSIALNDVQLQESGDIFSQNNGRVQELLAQTGQVLAAGGRLLSLEIADADMEVTSVSFFPLKDGKKIQPGMKIQITPDSVERQRFGGILGVVTTVSPLSITREGALSTVGNADVVQSLMTDGAYVEVRAKLETDSANASGYRWSSSKGPNLKVSAGVTHLSRITVEGRAPVTYLLPILRDATGVY